ncbi:hypothetical protein [Rhodovulum sulfidophilum]|uniref:hypothetical protein n=1 Tax=Rhodovulum sulfidophilum TaxID=35806 RepID=UPI001921C95B|nr:hypothetical protein [Rhodovulum sulfidophilum]MBL3560231.1 hypothetical protein [Rhodovulum sulfidophilum]
MTAFIQIATQSFRALAWAVCLALPPASLPGQTIPHPGAVRLALQNADARAPRPKSVIELQGLRASQRALSRDGTRLTLTSLNPHANGWFLLELERPGRQPETYHLENPAPLTRDVSLSDDPAPAILLTEGQAQIKCRPWAVATPELSDARASGLPFAPLCDGRLYLRNPVSGARTNLERTAEFLRDNLWFGESLVGLVKDTLYKDRYLASGQVLAGADPGAVDRLMGRAALRDFPVMYTTMTFDLVGATPKRMEMGAWYAIGGAPGIYASALQPRMIAPEILRRRGEANGLDGIEGRADVYFVAFDMTHFDIGYETGTEHPRLDWSSRPSGPGRNWSLPGPDGFDTARPLATVGMINPEEARRVAATFTGGFKRDHGAFRFGPMARSNNGHHYGFVVHGTVLSSLQPDLSTLYVLDDGTIGMKTWTEADNALLPQIRFARQNGVPIIERDATTGRGVVGPLVRQWGAGNWSGSANADLRTLRAGACMKTAAGRTFLIYGWFSTATPSAMARTFQAYGCDYAMLLDMNALEHTYMALYTPGKAGGLDTRHLVAGMSRIDEQSRDGRPIPRFIGFPDNRDFFYLMRKESPR